jgi:hypothetical protein
MGNGLIPGKMHPSRNTHAIWIKSKRLSKDRYHRMANIQDI